jgi:hypothetical protein
MTSERVFGPSSNIIKQLCDDKNEASQKIEQHRSKKGLKGLRGLTAAASFLQELRKLIFLGPHLVEQLDIMENCLFFVF